MNAATVSVTAADRRLAGVLAEESQQRPDFVESRVTRDKTMTTAPVDEADINELRQVNVEQF